MNHHLVEEGLVPRALTRTDSREEEAHDPELAQRTMAVAGRIASETVALLSMNARAMECYSPLTGKGERVGDFMWSNLGLHLENYEAAAREMGAEAGEAAHEPVPPSARA
jgi:hypothetical protein